MHKSTTKRGLDIIITAFVSMSVTPGSDEDLVKDFVKYDIVEEAWLTTGEFDVLLIMKAESTEDINEFVNHEIRGIEGVVRAVVTFGIQSLKHD
ncbi:Lrp/AsnC family transcriptional regulator [Candidatus Thorarchaeota archaeon]|nr:MAG: Lrp/AsnC family transcriptional regulator [Candidatus Thorarchaeota archaeon]